MFLAPFLHWTYKFEEKEQNLAPISEIMTNSACSELHFTPMHYADLCDVQQGKPLPGKASL